MKKNQWREFVKEMYHNKDFLPDVPIGEQTRFRLVCKEASVLYREKQALLGIIVKPKPYVRVKDRKKKIKVFTGS